MSMKFEQLVARFLRLERWFQKYQQIVHYLRNHLETTVNVHMDIVKRYSEINDKLDEINARLKQEKSFRDTAREQFKQVAGQIDALDESVNVLEDFHRSFNKSEQDSKILKKLIKQEKK